jgi:hypothetical protein
MDYIIPMHVKICIGETKLVGVRKIQIIIWILVILFVIHGLTSFEFLSKTAMMLNALASWLVAPT